MNDFLSKPYNLHELYDILAKWLPSDSTQTSSSAPTEPKQQFTGSASGEIEDTTPIPYSHSKT